MTSRFIPPFYDVGSGITPSSGSQLFFFKTDGATPKDTHTTKAATIANANPVIADSKGVFPDIYITGDYKITLKDKNGSQKFGLADINEFAAVTDGIFIKNFTTLAVAIADKGLVDGDTFRLTNDRGNSDWNVVLLSSVIVTVGEPAFGNIVSWGNNTGAATDLALSLDVNGEIDLVEWGVIVGGADSQAALQSVMDYTADNDLTLVGSSVIVGVLPIVPAGSNGVNWKENLNIEFKDVEFKLLGESFNGAFISSPLVDPGVDNTSVRTDNVNVKGLIVNCNDIAGENGIGCVGDNCSFDITYKNVRQHATRAGGKAVQMEGPSRKGIIFPNTLIVDCDIGISQQAADNDTAFNITDIVYTSVVMRNVAIPVLLNNTLSGTTDHRGDTRSCSLFIQSLECYNCGKVDWNNVTGTPGGMETEAGIILSDRGFGLRIDSLRLINETSYGAIGAITRGTMFNVQINNADIAAPFINAAHNFNSFIAGVLSSAGAGASFANTLFTKNIDARNCDFNLLIDDKPSSITAEIQIDLMINTDIANTLDKATVGGLVTTNYTSAANGFIEVRDVRISEQQFFKATISDVVTKNFISLISPMDMYTGIASTSAAAGTISKFPDGTMIISHIHEATTTISTVWGSLFTGVIGLPAYAQAFVGDLPEVTFFGESNGAQFSIGSTGVLGTLGTPPIVLLTRAVTLGSTAFRIHYIAKGRWK
jgi:hypothetical protein